MPQGAKPSSWISWMVVEVRYETTLVLLVVRGEVGLAFHVQNRNDT